MKSVQFSCFIFFFTLFRLSKIPNCNLLEENVFIVLLFRHFFSTFVHFTSVFYFTNDFLSFVLFHLFVFCVNFILVFFSLFWPLHATYTLFVWSIRRSRTWFITSEWKGKVCEEKPSSKKLTAKNSVVSVFHEFRVLGLLFGWAVVSQSMGTKPMKKKSLEISPRCQKVPRKMIRSIAGGYLSNTLHNICNEKEWKAKTALTRALRRKGKTCKVNTCIWSCCAAEWKESTSVEHKKLNWVYTVYTHTVTKSGTINSDGIKTERDCDSEWVAWQRKKYQVLTVKTGRYMKVKQKLMANTKDCITESDRLESFGGCDRFTRKCWTV